MRVPVSFIIIFSSLLSSCIEVVEVDVPKEESVIVLNAMFSPDEPWRVSLTLSAPINDGGSQFELVDDAVVTIYDGDDLVETLIYENKGFYVSSGKPVAGKAYEIQVNSPRYGKVSAHSVVPSVVEITDFEIVMQGTALGSQARGVIRFPDPPNEKNYYQILAHWQYRGSQFPPQVVQVYSEDPAVSIKDEFGNTIYDFYNGFVFSDTWIDGQEAELNFRCGPEEKLIITLRSITEDMFLYQKTLMLQRYFELDPFSQSIRVHSNVSEGYGIFAGYNSSVMEKTP
jgi:hypothetical protein